MRLVRPTLAGKPSVPWNDQFAVQLGTIPVEAMATAAFGQIVVGAAWKNVIEVNIVVGGAWKNVTEIQVVDTATWKDLIA